MARRAPRPSIESSVGTSRQPATSSPSWSRIRSTLAAAAAAAASSAGKKPMPVA